jgi:phage I-like protein
MGEQVKSSGKYTEAQMKYFNQLAKEEQAFELSAAFDKGTKVVNVLTGKVTIVK